MAITSLLDFLFVVILAYYINIKKLNKKRCFKHSLLSYIQNTQNVIDMGKTIPNGLQWGIAFNQIKRDTPALFDELTKNIFLLVSNILHSHASPNTELHSHANPNTKIHSHANPNMELHASPNTELHASPNTELELQISEVLYMLLKISIALNDVESLIKKKESAEMVIIQLLIDFNNFPNCFLGKTKRREKLINVLLIVSQLFYSDSVYIEVLLATKSPMQ